MQIEDLVLISTDDHVVEPPSMSEYFADHVSARFRDRVPKVIRRSDGSDAWLIEGKEIFHLRVNTVQGRPREAWGTNPASFDQVRPGTYDIDERIRGHRTRTAFWRRCASRSWPGIAGQFFVASDDHDFRGRDGARVQRLAHRRVVRGVSGPLHPAVHLGLPVGGRLDGRGNPPRGGQGVSRCVTAPRDVPSGLPRLPR